MTLLSRLLAFFPAAIISLASVSFVWLCLSESWLTGLLRLGNLLFVFYGLPLIAYRLHAKFHPIVEGVSYLKGEQYSPWWGSHQLQSIYIAVPLLESILRLVPGVFSAWLRLWGAKIGKDVYWGSIGEIADRGLLEVGDRTLIGHRVGLYAHIIKPKRDNLLLYVKAIEIGSDAFIGSGSCISAGVVVTEKAYLEAGSEIHPNRTVSTQQRDRKNSHVAGSLNEVEQCAK
ncbi:MAG: DapH/DapD/GlmU-related protein [Cyanobacteria bacterium P01_C01_bin.69]